MKFIRILKFIVFTSIIIFITMLCLVGCSSINEKDNFEEIKIADFSKVKVGEYVKFGRYEQDNNKTNGEEAIEWLVLNIENNRVLLVSRYALDCKPYNKDFVDTTWEGSTLRTWLNNDFIKNAFSEEERSMIPTVAVENNDNDEYNTDGGNNTQDKVFLLSMSEVEKYFMYEHLRLCGATDYVKAIGAYTSDEYRANGKDTCWWWLRSPGNSMSYAANVDYDGFVRENGTNVNFSSYAVRPALWIHFNS